MPYLSNDISDNNILQQFQERTSSIPGTSYNTLQSGSQENYRKFTRFVILFREATRVNLWCWFTSLNSIMMRSALLPMAHTMN